MAVASCAHGGAAAQASTVSRSRATAGHLRHHDGLASSLSENQIAVVLKKRWTREARRVRSTHHHHSVFKHQSRTLPYQVELSKQRRGAQLQSVAYQLEGEQARIEQLVNRWGQRQPVRYFIRTIRCHWPDVSRLNDAVKARSGLATNPETCDKTTKVRTTQDTVTETAISIEHFDQVATSLNIHHLCRLVNPQTQCIAPPLKEDFGRVIFSNGADRAALECMAVA